MALRFGAGFAAAVSLSDSPFDSVRAFFVAVVRSAVCG